MPYFNMLFNEHKDDKNNIECIRIKDLKSFKWEFDLDVFHCVVKIEKDKDGKYKVIEKDIPEHFNLIIINSSEGEAFVRVEPKEKLENAEIKLRSTYI